VECEKTAVKKKSFVFCVFLTFGGRGNGEIANAAEKENDTFVCKDHQFISSASNM